MAAGLAVVDAETVADATPLAELDQMLRAFYDEAGFFASAADGGYCR